MSITTTDKEYVAGTYGRFPVELVSGKGAKEFILSLGEDAVIQERLVCHKSITDIYPGSVNTFRVITYRWKDDVLHMPVIMRI